MHPFHVTPDRRWPEELQSLPRSAPSFPWRVLLKWSLPGIVGALVILGMFLYLEQRASRQIVFLRSDGSLASVRADTADVHTITVPGGRSATFGAPQWAPHGHQVATLVSRAATTSAELALVHPTTSTPPTTLEVDTLGFPWLPPQAWSSDAQHLMLLGRTESFSVTLTIVNVQQKRLTTSKLILDPRFSPQWHPSGQELATTALTAGITPTIQLVSINGDERPFTPSDEQAYHMDASWSHTGNRIAYITSASAKSAFGNLWVANSDGNNARELTKDNLSVAPIWAPRDDVIFFTRLVTATNALELYRIKPDGQDLQRIGFSTYAFTQPESDRGSLINWSPDGNKLFFQGTDPRHGGIVLSVASYNGDNAQVLNIERLSEYDQLTVDWAPTSRALLIATHSSQTPMRLRWINRQRPDILFPVGAFPSWQP